MGTWNQTSCDPKNATILQAWCASTLSCSNMWNSNYPHRHVNVIALHVFVAATVELQKFVISEQNFSPSEQDSDRQYKRWLWKCVFTLPHTSLMIASQILLFFLCSLLGANLYMLSVKIMYGCGRYGTMALWQGWLRGNCHPKFCAIRKSSSPFWGNLWAKLKFWAAIGKLILLGTNREWQLTSEEEEEEDLHRQLGPLQGSLFPFGTLSRWGLIKLAYNSSQPALINSQCL